MSFLAVFIQLQTGAGGLSLFLPKYRRKAPCFSYGDIRLLLKVI